MTSSIRLGANCWNQYTDWPSLLAAGKRVDALGYDTLWTWDQLQPSGRRPVGRCRDRRPLTDRCQRGGFPGRCAQLRGSMDDQGRSPRWHRVRLVRESECERRLAMREAANTERWRERFGRVEYLLDGGSSARSRRPALGHHA
jgi:hypothetical protein